MDWSLYVFSKPLRELIKTLNFIWMGGKWMLEIIATLIPITTSSVSKLSIANHRKLLTISSNFLSALSRTCLEFIAMNSPGSRHDFLGFQLFNFSCKYVCWDWIIIGPRNFRCAINLTANPSPTAPLTKWGGVASSSSSSSSSENRKTNYGCCKRTGDSWDGNRINLS